MALRLQQALECLGGGGGEGSTGAVASTVSDTKASNLRFKDFKFDFIKIVL